jgi:hypothetical protein
MPLVALPTRPSPSRLRDERVTARETAVHVIKLQLSCTCARLDGRGLRVARIVAARLTAQQQSLIGERAVAAAA